MCNMANKLTWPNGMCAAAMVTVELDNEYIWLGIDPTCHDRPKTLSNGTYGTISGLDRVLNSLKTHDVRATFFILGIMAEKYPKSVLKIAEAGHEIALHGYYHYDYMTLSAKEQAEDISRGLEALEKLLGEKPVGFRAPEGCVTSDTLRLIRDNGFLYDSSLLSNDVPYMLKVDGESTSVVEIPMHWEMHDFIYFAYNRNPAFPYGQDSISGYSDVLYNWQVELEAFTNYGLCYVCKFDPQTIGSPGKIFLLDRLLDDMVARNIWIATGSELAEYTKSFEA